MEHHQNPQTSFCLRRIEYGVNRRGGLLSHVEKRDAEEPLAKVNAELLIETWNRVRNGREELIERGGNVFLEAQPVFEKESFFYLVDEGRSDPRSHVVVLREHALLTAGKSETIEIHSQRHDRELPSAMKHASVAKEDDAEVPPSLGPEPIHLGGRSIQTQKMLIVGCGGHGIWLERGSAGLGDFAAGTLQEN